MPFDFPTARTAMLDGQIRPNKVTDPRLLAALESVPRERFVQDGHQGFAYAESEAPAATGRMLMAPMVLARMVDALRLTPAMTALDIAPATGYSSAIMAALCARVVGLDADAALTVRATQLCAQLDIPNVQFVHGPLSLGAKNFAPYDAMLINGAVAEVPRTLFHQLAEGGRMVALVASAENGFGTATLYTKRDGVPQATPLFEASASYLAGFAPHEEFAL